MSSDLAELIDRVLETGNWKSINVFKNLASLHRNNGGNAYSPSQLSEENAKPSDHLRDLLEQHLREGRWAHLPLATNVQGGDLDLESKEPVAKKKKAEKQLVLIGDPDSLDAEELDGPIIDHEDYEDLF